MTGLGAEVEDAGRRDELVGQMMDRVGIVPEQPEIRSPGPHRGQPPRRRLAVDVPGGVGVFRHAPQALDGRAIVARHRAKERRGRCIPPRGGQTRNALQQGPDDAVVHHGQARVVAGDDPFGRCPEDVGDQHPELGKPLRSAVIASIDARLGEMIAVARQRQQPARQVELGRRRFAPRHVERQTAGLERRIVVSRRRERLGVFDHGGLRWA